MMDILFKAKRMDNGEWIQGYLFLFWGKSYILWGMVNDSPDMIEVIPDTICQYTGLTDKNGNKIWENDVIKHYNKVEIGEPDKYMIASIRWEHNNVRFVQDTEEGKYSIIGSRYFEVIGNIFDGEFQNDSEGTKKD